MTNQQTESKPTQTTQQRPKTIRRSREHHGETQQQTNTSSEKQE